MEEKKIVPDKPQEIATCMFDLGNGQFVRELSGAQKFRSLVVDVDEQRGVALGLCPTLMMLPWSYNLLNVDTSSILSGREATEVLLQEAAKQGIELAAVTFCANYTTRNVKKGEAFLPACFEVAKLAAHKRELKAVMTTIGFNKCDYTFWSSTVDNEANVWMQSLCNHSVSGWKPQLQTFGVMPMIEITL